MGLEKQRTGQIGVNVVERIVLNEWSCRWQAIDAQNDDGIDGLIFFERGGDLTGEVLFAQVKCIALNPDAQGDYGVPVSAEKLTRLLSLWRRVVGGAILILVDPKTLVARWVDVRNDLTHTDAQIKVPGSQLFNQSSKNLLRRMCGTVSVDLQASQVDTVAGDFKYLAGRDHIQTSSRRLYRDLSARALRLSGGGPAVGFDRVGWHHITRRRRNALTRYQSFALLGCVPKILEANSEDRLRPWGNSGKHGKRLFSFDSMVTFPFRQTGLVRLVLERLSDGRGYRFYTIYEPRRKADLAGVRRPRRP